MATTKEGSRERLLQERERLLAEIGALGYIHGGDMNTLMEGEHYTNHMADIATETFEQEKNLALELNLQRMLRATEDALHRLDSGTYGICTNCGEAIPPERLEVLPHASLCVKCKKEQEALR